MHAAGLFDVRGGLVTRRVDTAQARDALGRALERTGGGEEGLARAVSFAWAELGGLEVQDREDALVRASLDLRGRSHRDPRGLVLTPPPVASALHALIDEMSPGGAAVLDPCCGTGRLLAPWTSPMRVGVDVDPVGVALGRCARGDEIEWHVADGLAFDRPGVRPGALRVVCNPPWVATYARRSQAVALDADRLRRVQGVWARGAAHPMVAFVARVVRDLLRPGEAAGFVLPDVVLTGVRHAPLRAALAAHVDEARVVRLAADTFGGVVAHPILLGVRRASVPALAGRDAALQRVAFAEGAVPKAWSWATLELDDVWRALAPTTPWVPPTAALPALRRLASTGAPRLGELVEVRDGVNPGPAAARAALVAPTPDALSMPRPAVEGRDVHPGRIAPPRLWVEGDARRILPEWSAAGASLRAPSLFDGPRLYSRQTGGRLVVGFADDTTMALNSVHVMRPHRRDTSRTEDDRPDPGAPLDGRDLPNDPPSVPPGDPPSDHVGLARLMAWLNTPLATELYLGMYAESQASFPQVKVTWLRTLPVPWPLTHHEARLADAWVERLDSALLTALDAAVRRRLGDGDGGAP